jgi:hypothetical protein
MKSSSQIKNSVESLSLGLDQNEDKILGFEDKVDVLEHSDKIIKNKEGIARSLRHH